MKHYSLLDLIPVPEGKETADALTNAGSLAVAAEKAGYHRYWVAEHHNMKGIASSATAVLVGYLGSLTKTMRIGAGGIMLPNHTPLVVAEQFGTMASIYNNRIDLGLGRAPGTDMATARALRRHMAQEDTFFNDVQELISYFADAQENAPVKAIPGVGTHTPVWILGSSLYGAQLAAYLGLPYAFASHFAPDMIEQALAVYRESFQPSDALSKPYVVVAANAWAAETDAQATYLKSSQLRAFANIVTNNRGKLPKPVDDITAVVQPQVLAQARRMLSCSIGGSKSTISAQAQALLERYQPDELMLTSMIHDHEARVRSFEISAEVMSDLQRN